jgi:hypothetical protein
VEFFANRKLIGSDSDIATNKFKITWRNVQEGEDELTAVATDHLGLTHSAKPVPMEGVKRTTNH